ncbi:MAG TPA: transporter [Verrucomicrobiae bacterium]|nr:transporter [Verrucomicrobiae bacterium]
MLSNYDYLVIGFYFAFMAVIGWVCRKFIGNTSDYFRGGGKMLWWMAGCSAFVAQFSAWTFTGAAGKAYQDGPVIMVIYLGNALGFFCNYLFFAPRFRQMRVITSIQAVRARFGNGSEQFFTWVQLPVGVLYAGIWLSGLAVFISAAFNMDLVMTIIVTGSVVVLMSVIGGSWAVAAGDFIQTLVLMPITLVTAFLAVAQVGGWNRLLEKMPRHYIHWTDAERPEILYLWIIAIIIKQFISTNNMLEASRYLNAKDSRQARNAALLASMLFIIGPIFWFIPPMVARVVHPDLRAVFPGLKNPAEGAFVVAGLDTMPVGMLGLLISGIFGATMSNMDVGLNKNAGYFAKNFYQVVLRPRAPEQEMLLVSKIVTFLLGMLVIAAALVFSTGTTGLFNLMLQFGGLIALPYCIPLIWGTLIKRAPSWAGWTTVVVGFATSYAGKKFLTAEWIQGVMGWGSRPLSGREADDWVLLLGVLLDAIVCTTWFLGACLFARARSTEEQERVERFFTQMRTPVDFRKEEGEGNDAQQYRTLGLLSLVYGAFISLLVLIPNSPGGRLGMLTCAGTMLGVGGLLGANSRRLQARNSLDNATKKSPQ